jgi:hypothetical protein
MLRFDWRKHRKRIESLHEELLNGHPTTDRWSLVTTFDYKTVPPTITAGPALRHLPNDYHSNRAVRLEFDQSVTRAKASRGRLALMCIYIEGIRSSAVITIVVPDHDG